MSPRPHRAILAAVTLLAVISGCAPTAMPPRPPTAETGAQTLGPADGYLAVGESVALGDDVPAMTNLAPDLRDALERAAAAAAIDRDVEFTFTSGWRSARYQQSLFDDAVATYGSEAEARRWVLPPDQSQHVLGNAVDVATADAMDWLNRFGAEFGLCQTYANELWHFELVAGVTETCPEQLLDGSAG